MPSPFDTPAGDEMRKGEALYRELAGLARRDALRLDNWRATNVTDLTDAASLTCYA